MRALTQPHTNANGDHAHTRASHTRAAASIHTGYTSPVRASPSADTHARTAAHGDARTDGAPAHLRAEGAGRRDRADRVTRADDRVDRVDRAEYMVAFAYKLQVGVWRVGSARQGCRER